VFDETSVFSGCDAVQIHMAYFSQAIRHLFLPASVLHAPEHGPAVALCYEPVAL
jgi:hypothetical protein